MKPIQIHVRGSEKEAANIDFASQEKDERDLSDRHPCCSESHTLPVICVVNDRPDCEEQGDDNPVCEYDQRRPKRRRTPPRPGQLGIGYFSKDCQCRCICLGCKVPWSRGVRKGERAGCAFT